MAEDATVINQVEIEDLDSILGVPGGDNVIIPEGEKQNNIFSARKKVDTSFIDKTEEEIKTPDNETPEAKLVRETAEAAALAAKKVTAEELADLLKQDEIKTPEELAEEKKNAGGRPNAAVELAKKLIEKKLLVPFDDNKAIEDYTIKDFEELFEANVTDRENQIMERTPVEFFDSLPEKLQVAAKYHADGGKDLKGLFRVLSEVEDTRALDPEDPKDQEQIVREYLRATRFGNNEEDIDEEITDWKDQNKLEEKSKKFKPKLDSMKEGIVAQKLAAQETLSKQQALASQNYTNSVYETLKPAELNGVKLDKKTQGMLYSGLVQANYPSMSGKPTNLLGHLLEKYQVVEPDHGLIAEALWLLADPDGYRDKIREVGKTAAVEKTVRTLKTAEAQKIASSVIVEEDKIKQRTIPRNNDNFFKR